MVIRQVLHKVFSISLAIIVLCSTVSFTVEKHFCGNKLIDVAVFTELDKCAMDSEEITKKHCCKDKVDIVQGQDELIVKTFDDLDLEQPLFVASFAYSFINLFEGLPQQVIPHKDYSPPILVANKQILDQVFLI